MDTEHEASGADPNNRATLPKVDRSSLSAAHEFLSVCKPTAVDESLVQATLDDSRFLKFHKGVAGSVKEPIGTQMRKGPAVVAQALTWIEDEDQAETFWCSVRAGDRDEDPCGVLHYWMTAKGVRKPPNGGAHKDAVTWRQRFAQCMYAWRCWRDDEPMTKQFVDSGECPDWSEQ